LGFVVVVVVDVAAVAAADAIVFSGADTNHARAGEEPRRSLTLADANAQTTTNYNK
jgi:hypothetical protein